MLASNQAEYPIFRFKEGNKVRASKTRNGKSRNVAGYNPEMWASRKKSRRVVYLQALCVCGVGGSRGANVHL